MRIETLDLVIIIAYLVGIVALGLFASRHEKNTTSDYFLAGRSLRWPMIGMALFATNISTVHLVGLASSGYKDGLVFGNFEWLATFCLNCLLGPADHGRVSVGCVLAPRYESGGVLYVAWWIFTWHYRIHRRLPRVWLG